MWPFAASWCQKKKREHVTFEHLKNNNVRLRPFESAKKTGKAVFEGCQIGGDESAIFVVKKDETSIHYEIL